MLNQQLKQLSEELKKLKSKKNLTTEDMLKINKIEEWFKKYDEEH